MWICSRMKICLKIGKELKTVGKVVDRYTTQCGRW